MGFGSFGLAKGAAHSTDWGAVMTREMQNERMDLEAASIKENKVKALADATTEQEALNERNKEPLREYYDGLHEEMGALWAEYEDPYQSAEAMQKLNNLSARFKDNEILRQDRDLTKNLNLLKADYQAGLVDDEDYLNMKAQYDEYASNPGAEIPFVYSRPEYEDTSSILADIGTLFEKSMLPESTLTNTVMGYTEDQFDTMVDVSMSNADAFSALKKNFLLERRQLGMPTEYDDGAKLKSDMRSWIRSNYKSMYPKGEQFNASVYNALNKTNKPKDIVTADMENAPFQVQIVGGDGLRNPDTANAFAQVKKGSPLNTDSDIDKSVTIGFGKGNDFYGLKLQSIGKVLSNDEIVRTESGDIIKSSIITDPVALFNGARESVDNISLNEEWAKAKVGDNYNLNQLPIDQTQLEILNAAIEEGATLAEAFGHIFPVDATGKNKISGFDEPFYKKNRKGEEFPNPKAMFRKEEDGSIIATKEGLAYLIATKNAVPLSDPSSATMFSNPLSGSQVAGVTLRNVHSPAAYTTAAVNKFNASNGQADLNTKKAREDKVNKRGNTQRLGSVPVTDGVNEFSQDIYLNRSDDRIPSFGSNETLTIVQNGKEKTVGITDYFVNQFKPVIPSANASDQEKRDANSSNSKIKSNFKSTFSKLMGDLSDAEKALYIEDAESELLLSASAMQGASNEKEILEDINMKIKWINELK